MEIKLVDYGVANNFGDCIEINKELKQFPKLYKSILTHELEHTQKPFSLFDLKIDIKNKISTIELIKFMITRPKTWTQALPIYIKNRKLIYDFNLIILYLIAVPLEIFIIKFFFF